MKRKREGWEGGVGREGEGRVGRGGEVKRGKDDERGGEFSGLCALK